MKSAVPSERLERINLALGASLASIGIMFAAPSVAALNAGIVGSLIVCCSVVSLVRHGVRTEWFNFSLGCWAMAAPFLLGFSAAQAATWTHVVVGFSIATIATMQILASRTSTKSAAHKAMR